MSHWYLTSATIYSSLEIHHVRNQETIQFIIFQRNDVNDGQLACKRANQQFRSNNNTHTRKMPNVSGQQIRITTIKKLPTTIRYDMRNRRTTTAKTRKKMYIQLVTVWLVDGLLGQECWPSTAFFEPQIESMSTCSDGGFRCLHYALDCPLYTLRSCTACEWICA